MDQSPYLPPYKLQLRQRSDGGLLMEMDGQSVELAAPKRTMPLSDPDHYIMLSDENGQELGIIRNPEELDNQSRDVLQEALKRAYVIDLITRILEVEKEALTGQTRWRVEIALSESADASEPAAPSGLSRALGALARSDARGDERNKSLGRVRWLLNRDKDEAKAPSPADTVEDEDTTRIVTEEREFMISGPEDIKTARYPHIYIVDTDGHRYEIPDCESLDLASRRAAERFF
jgi:hypothetical protein